MTMEQRQKVRLTSRQKIVLIREFFKQGVSGDIVVRENPRTITHIHSYGGLSKFFEGLTQGKLMGTTCTFCGSSIWLPPRVDCPDCWEKTTWFEINTTHARVYSFSTTNRPGAGFKMTTPCPLISVEIPGVGTKFMSYLSEFGQAEPHIGMRIRPKFRTKNPTYSILDISWVPLD